MEIMSSAPLAGERRRCGKGRDLGTGPIELTYNYADWPILPYPAEKAGTRFLVGDPRPDRSG